MVCQILRKAAETYGYLLVREPGFAANVELLLKLYNAGATLSEVPTVNDWSRRAGVSNQIVPFTNGTAAMAIMSGC